MELIIFQQQNDEEKDLTGSGVHQAQFPVRKVAKGASSSAWWRKLWTSSMLSLAHCSAQNSHTLLQSRVLSLPLCLSLCVRNREPVQWSSYLTLTETNLCDLVQKSLNGIGKKWNQIPILFPKRYVFFYSCRDAYIYMVFSLLCKSLHQMMSIPIPRFERAKRHPSCHAFGFKFEPDLAFFLHLQMTHSANLKAVHSF